MAEVDCARCHRQGIDPTQGCPACGNEDHLLPALDDAAWREMVEAAIIDLTQRVYALEHDQRVRALMESAPPGD